MNKYITQNPAILGGKPIIAGTRMSVEVILESLAGGMSIKEMLKEYPFLKKEHIQAAIDYAAFWPNSLNIKFPFSLSD